ncbi:MAG: hypothetical protein Q9178_000164 [Gyalolechia marmorata]
MPSSEALTDDYVAQLLAKDAKDRTIKYSSYGLQAILPKRPTTNAPKPNTRFLKNIIKETDSHNAALRAKEIADARLRLRGINGKGLRKAHRGLPEDDRRDENGRSIKRRRLDEADEHADQNSQPSHRHKNDERSERRRRRHYANHSSDTETERSRHRSHHRRRQHNRSTLPGSDRTRRRRSRHRHRSRSKPRARSRSPDKANPSHWHHQSHQKRRPSTSPPPVSSSHHTTYKSSPPPSPRSPSTQSSASDSDPLTSLIGPLPPRRKHDEPSSLPPLRRGRGTHTLNSSSAPIDTHFTSTYNPALDIQATALDPSEEGDDWDNALEALRDRAKWRSSGAERLRAAGFTDEEVRKWEKSSGDGEGREADVRWRGRGEGREWDRGKVVGADGVQVEAEWGRLKSI